MLTGEVFVLSTGFSQEISKPRLSVLILEVFLLLPLRPKKRKYSFLWIFVLLFLMYMYVSFFYQRSLLHIISKETKESAHENTFSFPWYKTLFITPATFHDIQKQQNILEIELQGIRIQKINEAILNVKTLQTIEGNIDTDLYLQEKKKIEKSTLNEIKSILEEQKNRLRTALFSDDFTSYIHTRKSEVSVAVYNQFTGQTYVYQPEKTFKTASIMKVSVMASLFLHHGFNDTTEDKVSIMIRQSDNDAVDSLWEEAGGDQGLKDTWSKMGLSNTFLNEEGHWGLTTTTAADQVKVMKAVTLKNSLFTSYEQQHMRQYLQSVAADQKWGVSGGVPSTSVVELKNGWSPAAEENWRINSIGHIQDKTHNYVIAILTYKNPTQEYGIHTIEQLSSLLYTKLEQN